MYKLPNKSLLEKESEELDNDKYYNLSKLIYHKDFKDNFVIPLGIDNNKEKYYLDLKNISGMLISGETGSGKSIFLHSIIISLLLKNTPEELKYIIYDKRDVELSNYLTLPHLYKNMFSFDDLSYVVDLILERQNLFLEKGYTNINNYNEKEDNKLPRIVVLIDEMGEIINLELFKDNLTKILLDGYKYGIHLILSTSSYLKDYYDSKLIDLFNYILTFDLASQEQAKFVKIDDANLLSIEGDALIKCKNNNIINIQTPYVSLKDIENVINFIKNNNM